MQYYGAQPNQPAAPPPPPIPQPRYAVAYYRKPTNHMLHIFLSFVTGGVWFLAVYLPLLIIRSKKQKIVTTY